MYRYNRYVILIGICVAVVFLLLEVLINASVPRLENFVDELLFPEHGELWIRIIVTCMIIGFSVYAGFIIAKQRRTEEMLKQHTKEINRQVRTIECLYNIHNLVENPDVSEDEVFRKVVALIPSAWERPEQIGVRLTFKDRTYLTDNFRETSLKECSDIHACAEVVGRVEVFLLEGDVEFTDEERRFIHSIARHLGNFVEIKQANRAIKWQAGINGAMAELSEALIASRSVDEISSIVLEHSKKLTRSRFGFVGYIDRKTGHLVCPTMTRDIWDICKVKNKSIVFERYGGLWGWVLKNKKSVLTNDPANDERSAGVPEGHIPIENFLSAPAVVDGRLVGQISLANSDRKYTDQDLVVVERLATIYAIAIERACVEKELQERIDELERFRKATVEREFRMKELKDENRSLRAKVEQLERWLEKNR